MKQDLIYFLPQMVLIGTIFLLFFGDFILGARGGRFYPVIAFIGVLLMLIVHHKLHFLPPARIFSGMLTMDPMNRFFTNLFGVAGLLGIVISVKSPEVQKSDPPSYYTLLIAIVLGMTLLASSSHLLMIYLSLEMVSVLSYILTGRVQGVRRSQEAALKYVIYGGVASGIMAYGFSLLYGMTGTMDLYQIASFLTAHAVSRPVLFAAVLLSLAGFGYKIASFPFHMWCPDVYEGAPTPFTAFLSVGPKAAGFAALMRFFIIALSQKSGTLYLPLKMAGWSDLLIVLSMATMTIGNLSALGQTNLKRLLAYSSIAHAGYMLMGFCALSDEALSAVLFYLVVYLIMNIGAFLVVILIQNQLGTETLDGYRGLGRRGGSATWLALLLGVFLFSLTGLPPMAGFVGKFYLFGAVMHAGLYKLALVGVLNSVVSLYYYVRVIKVMFLDEAPEKSAGLGIGSGGNGSWWPHSVVVSTLAILTLYLGLFWNHLATVTVHSASLF